LATHRRAALGRRDLPVLVGGAVSTPEVANAKLDENRRSTVHTGP
jgi:hypothetical protein